MLTKTRVMSALLAGMLAGVGLWAQDGVPVVERAVTIRGVMASPAEPPVPDVAVVDVRGYLDEWMLPEDEGDVMPAFSRAREARVPVVALRPGATYAARPTATHGAIRPWSGLRLEGNGARIVVEAVPYLVEQEGRQRYQLVASAADTRDITIRDLTIEYVASPLWRNLTLDAIHLEGEYHTLVEVTVLRPRAGATRECFPLALKGPGNYPNPTHRMVRCRVMWPQPNADDERPGAYVPEFTPFFVGGGEIRDCQAWLYLDSQQVAPCQGASGRGRSLTITGTRIHVRGDVGRAKSVWVQLPEGSGLPNPTISDNQVVRIF